MTVTAIRRAVARIALAAIAAIGLLEWILAIAAPEGGPLAVLQVFAPHIAIAGLVACPVALATRRRGPILVAGALLLVVGLRFGGTWLSLPTASATGDGARVEIATWNLEVFSRPAIDTAAFLRATAADVVALQELQPEAAAAIEADPELRIRFPYRALVPRDDVGGTGILSRVPIGGASFALGPAVQEVTLDLGGGRHLAVLNVHPFHADIATLGSTRLPIGLDVTQRNADLAAIRARLGARIAAGMPVVVVGDLNTADSEPAFGRLAEGLRDVHGDVGQGTGWTWRPRPLEFLGIGLIRIDHVIVSPDIVPLGVGEACPAIGDHCLVHAAFAVP